MGSVPLIIPFFVSPIVCHFMLGEPSSVHSVLYSHVIDSAIARVSGQVLGEKDVV